MICELSLIGGLFLFWAAVSALCFKFFPCPDHLHPKNNENKKKKAYFDYYGNYTSIFHAIVTVILGVYVLLTEETTLGAQNTPLVSFVVYNSFAYFLFDTIFSEYHRYNNLAMTFHHITAVSVTGSMAYLNNSGNEIVIALLLAEISNPFNLIREILKHFKKEGTELYFYDSLVFAALFIITRFIFVPIQLSMVYPGATHIAVKVFAATIWFISWHWLFVILNFASKEIKNFLSSQDKSKGGSWGFANSFLNGLRRNKTFMQLFYVTAGLLSFGPLYLCHNTKVSSGVSA